jgi:hypothetical protein
MENFRATKDGIEQHGEHHQQHTSSSYCRDQAGARVGWVIHKG